MDSLSIRFSIKRLLKTTDQDYIKALQIYTDTTPVDIKTNSNEISYWLNKSKDNDLFEPLYFAIYCDNDVIGFAMMSYLKSSKIIVIEYMALLESYRINSVFFPVLNLLFNYLEINSYDINYYVNEVSNKNDGESVDRESKLFKKMICMESFGKIEAPYYTLPLGVNNFESSFDAYLYVRTKDSISAINKDTYLHIIHSIYYDYFQEWYVPFLTDNELQNYKTIIDTTYKRIVQKLSEKTSCKVFIPQQACPLHSACNINTSGTVTTKSHQAKFKLKLSLILLAIIIIPILLILLYNSILNLIGIEINSVHSALGSIFSVLISSTLTLFLYKKKN